MSNYKDQPKTTQIGKSGYDIRTDILMMAKDIALKEYESEFRLYELYLTLGSRNSVFDNTPNKPAFPPMTKILEIANSMNDFVGKK